MAFASKAFASSGPHLSDLRQQVFPSNGLHLSDLRQPSWLASSGLHFSGLRQKSLWLAQTGQVWIIAGKYLVGVGRTGVDHCWQKPCGRRSNKCGPLLAKTLLAQVGEVQTTAGKYFAGAGRTNTNHCQQRPCWRRSQKCRPLLVKTLLAQVGQMWTCRGGPYKWAPLVQLQCLVGQVWITATACPSNVFISSG